MSDLPPVVVPSRKYAVFISYRHDDNKEIGRQWASWLHQALETYEVPPDLVGTENDRSEPIPSSLYPIFRDEEEIPASANLGEQIRAALEDSWMLVVLCSPRAVGSQYVAEEVRSFKELGRTDRILALIIDGEPNADAPGKLAKGIKPEWECFPEPLRFGRPKPGSTTNPPEVDWTAPAEPVAADVRPGGRPVQGWTTAAAYSVALGDGVKPKERRAATEAYEDRLRLAKLKIVAGALGVPLGVLSQRDKAHQLAQARRRAKIARRVAVALLILAGLAGAAAVFAWLQRDAAITARGLVERREAEQRRMLHDASMSDFAVAVNRIEKENLWQEGVAHLARALDWEPGNAVAAARLYATLCDHGLNNQSWPRHILQHDVMVVDAAYSQDGTRVVTVGNDHTSADPPPADARSARLFDTRTGSAIGQRLKHADDIHSAQFSPDGTLILTAAGSDMARLWDAVTGAPIGERLTHEEDVNAAQFSPDGLRIITASDDKTAQVWDTRSRAKIGEPLRHDEAVRFASFSPEGSKIVTATDDEFSLWEAATGKRIAGPNKQEGGMAMLRFSPDGTRIVTAGGDGMVVVWNATTGKQDGARLEHTSIVYSAEFSPDGSRLVTASHDETGRIWDAATHKPIGEPLTHFGPMRSARFSPDGLRIVTTGEDGAARVWDGFTGSALGVRLRHQGVVAAAQFSPDGRHLVTACIDGTARVWDAPTGRAAGEPFRVGDGEHRHAAFDRTGARILVSSHGEGRKTARSKVWEIGTGRLLTELVHPHDTPFRGWFSTDGARIVTESSKTIQAWDAATGAMIGSPYAAKPLGKGDAVSTDGSRIATHDHDVVYLWDRTNGRLLSTISEKGIASFDSVSSPKYSLVAPGSFSPDGSRLLWSSDRGDSSSARESVRVWDVASGQAIGPWMRDVEPVAMNRDGSHLAAVAEEGSVTIWDSSTGKPVTGLLSHAGGAVGVCLSPDKLLAATIGKDGSIVLWELPAGKQRAEALRHASEVLDADFSPDGMHIATAGRDKTVRIRNLATSAEVGKQFLHDGAVISVKFDATGARLVTVSDDDRAQVWNVATGERVARIKRPEKKRDEESDPADDRDVLEKAWFTADGSGIQTARAGYGDRYETWDATTGARRGELDDNPTVEMSDDASRVITTYADGSVREWDLASGRPLGGRRVSDRPSARKAVDEEASEDEAEAEQQSSSGQVAAWDAKGRRKVTVALKHATDVERAFLSPDGARVATISQENEVGLWNAVTGDLLGKRPRHYVGVLSASFSRDSAFFVTTSFSQGWILDASTCLPYGEPLHARHSVASAEFSPDGSKIVTSSGGDQSARVWHVGHVLRPALPVPPWMRDRARALAGLRFNAAGELEDIPVAERRATMMAPPPGEDAWTGLARWLMQPAAERTIHPDSPLGSRKLAERERDAGTTKSVKAALRYDPAVPLGHLVLAGVVNNQDHDDGPNAWKPELAKYAGFLRDYTTRRLPDDPALWERAVRELHAQKDEPRTRAALERLRILNPERAAAWDREHAVAPAP